MSPPPRKLSLGGIARSVGLAAGLWPWCNPPPVLAGLYLTDPAVVRSPMGFVPRLRQLLEALTIGLLHTA